MIWDFRIGLLKYENGEVKRDLGSLGLRTGCMGCPPVADGYRTSIKAKNRSRSSHPLDKIGRVGFLVREGKRKGWDGYSRFDLARGCGLRVLGHTLPYRGTRPGQSGLEHVEVIPMQERNETV